MSKQAKPSKTGVSKKVNGLNILQQEYIQNMIPMRFNVTEICKKINITRGTYHGWLADNPHFRQAVLDARKYITDKSEEVIMRSVEMLDVKSAQFFLTKLNPEYKDRLDITSDDKPITNINFNLFTKKKDEESE